MLVKLVKIVFGNSGCRYYWTKLILTKFFLLMNCWQWQLFPLKQRLYLFRYFLLYVLNKRDGVSHELIASKKNTRPMSMQASFENN